jgi:Zn-dependent protease with chaperone function
MYISNPFGAKAYQGFQKLFMTHPPLAERIEALIGKVNDKV